MSNAIRKIASDSGQYDYVTAINPNDYSETDWVIDPDISAVSNVLRIYWKWNGSTVVEMSESEKSVVDYFRNQVDDTPVQVLTAYNEQYYELNETKMIDLSIYGEKSNITLNSIMDPKSSIVEDAELLSAAGSGPTGWDAKNKTTLENSINNGSYTDLVYNNSSPGNTSGIIIGIDMKVPTTINFMKRWDYSATYYDKVWEFIGTNDPSADEYTVIFKQEQESPFLDVSAPFEKSFSDVTFRYYGWRCVTSNNSTYTITRELEFFYGLHKTVEKTLKYGDDYDFYVDENKKLYITNKGTARTMKVILMGDE